MKKIIISISFLVLFPLLLTGTVTVVKRATNVNPKLYFKGIKNDSVSDTIMESSLKKCGWFDVVSSSRDVRYIVEGYNSGGKITVKVTEISGNTAFQVAMSDSVGKKEAVYKITDSILHKLFNIPGICNSKIAFVAQLGKNKEIYVCCFDGSTVKGITANKTLSLEPVWGLNNTLIVYTMYRSTYTDIVGKSLVSGKTHRLAVFPGLNNSAAVSPNGKYIALILSRDRQVELYVKELKGRGIKRLTKDTAVEGSPCWSPKGRYLCYVSDKYGRPSLYIYDLRTNKNMRVKTLGSEAVTPDWSAVSNKIVYSVRFGKQYTLAVYDVVRKTSNVVDINSAGNWMGPSWAPDGRHVVCSRDLNHNSQLYIVDTWTGKARRLLNYKYNLTSPSWSGLLNN